MNRLIFFVFLIFISAIGCKKEEGTVESEGVFIRIENISSYNFKKILVESAGQQVNYEDLNPGEKSVYQVFAKAYRYAYIELEIDDNKYVLQPIDFVGETELENGKYTYQINVTTLVNQFGSLQLQMGLKKEE